MNPFHGFGDVSPLDFVTRFWDRQPLHASGIVDPSVLNLTAHHIYDEYVRQGKFSDGFTSYHGDNDTRKQGRNAILALWSEGQTPDALKFAEFNRRHALIVQGGHRHFPELAAMMVEWRYFFNCRLNTNIYLTRPGSSVFATHYDQHHVVVMQVDGEKEWLLWPPTVDAPDGRYRFADVESEGEPLTWHTKQGDAIYIPLGWVHRAKTVGDHSVHITLGINPPRWLELIEQAVEEAAGEYSLLRRSLPLRFSPDRGLRFFADDSRHVEPVLGLLMKDMVTRMQVILERNWNIQDERPIA